MCAVKIHPCISQPVHIYHAYSNSKIRNSIEVTVFDQRESNNSGVDFINQAFLSCFPDSLVLDLQFVYDGSISNWTSSYDLGADIT